MISTEIHAVALETGFSERKIRDHCHDLTITEAFAVCAVAKAFEISIETAVYEVRRIANRHQKMEWYR